MSKIAAEKVREFRAEAKFQRSSPQKTKLVLDTIKGMRVELLHQEDGAGRGEGVALGHTECDVRFAGEGSRY